MKLVCRIVAVIVILLGLTVSIRFHMSEMSNKNNITDQDVVDIYNNLQKYTGMPGQIPPLLIVENPVVNAWITTDNLTITRGIINFVKDKDELAAVIGHEMGHFALGHLRGELQDGSRMHEENCDKFGLALMLRAGYNPCEAQEVWKRFDAVYGDDIETETHPSPSQRVWQLDLPMCHMLT